MYMVDLLFATRLVSLVIGTIDLRVSVVGGGGLVLLNVTIELQSNGLQSGWRDYVRMCLGH